jgi:hypothetical protein
VAEQVTGSNVWCNSGATRVGVTGGELGELPGSEAKLMRTLAGSGAQQGGGFAVVQGVLRGGTRRAVALGFGGCRRV